jgi:hypothetical protein
MMKLLTVILGFVIATQLPEAKPLEPIGAILDAFRTHDIVALGEVHGDLNSLELRVALIRDPRFAEIVNDIVVEVGNARYQDAIDRYVRGEDIPRAVIREACQNTTNHNMGPDFPSFEEIFHVVRALNQTLPAERRLRILLGDPPFDWSKVKSTEDLYRDDRDKFVADLITRESLARKRRTLIAYGHMHYLRGPRPSIVTYLENAGHKVFSIATMTQGGLSTGQSSVYSWPLPSLARLQGTALGAAEIVLFQPLRFEQRFDAVIVDALAPGSVPREYCDDPEYVKMRLFRLELRGQGDMLRRFCGIKQH